MVAITFERALFKGYPEYRDDQPRGEDGRWGGGGSVDAASRRKSPTSASGVSGKKPKSPRSPNPANAERNRRARERYAAGREKESKRIREMADRVLNDPPKPRSADDQRLAREALDYRDQMKSWPDEVWYKPGLADELWDFITSFETTVGALLLGGITGGVSTSLWGGAFAITGTYLMLRYAWRKLTTLGRYKGVRRSVDDDLFSGLLRRS